MSYRWLKWNAKEYKWRSSGLNSFIKVALGKTIFNIYWINEYFEGRSPEARGRSQNRARSSEAVFAYLHILSYTYIHVHIPTSTYIYLQQSEIDQRRDKMHRRPKNTTANRKTPQQTETDQTRTKNTTADRKTPQQTEKHHSKPKNTTANRNRSEQNEKHHSKPKNTTVYMCILQIRIRTTVLPVHC